MKLAVAFATTMCLAVLGCSSDADDGASGSAAAGGDNPNAYSFDTPTYELQPGEEKRYMCSTIHLPEGDDFEVQEITPTYGQGTHHLGVYRTIAEEPDGVFECPELVRDTWIPLYGGGIESGTLKAPEGGAFHIPAGTQILVQLHLFNTTPDAMEDKATITFTKADHETPTPAGMFGFDNRAIMIPAHSKDVAQEMSCESSVDMDVFAVFGHMHQRGKTITVKREGEVVYQDEWKFDDQPTTAKSFHVSAGDKLDLGCTYDNDTDEAMGYGESSNDEMCSFVFYYTPFETLTGCLKMPE